MKYILKDGTEIEDIPIGKSSVIIGEINKRQTLEVVARAQNTTTTRGAKVICKCICGKYTVLSLNSFRSGSTYSCGCLGKEVHRKTCKELGKKSYHKDYTNVKNIFYDFIEPLNKFDKNGCQYWATKCKKCGKIYETVPVYLINDNRPKGLNPCECYRRISKGVLKIEQILKENQISYKKEVRFDSCVTPKNNLMKFDFYINDSYLLEYDGEQHFLPEKFNINIDGEEKLRLQKEYDDIKNQWCKNNNIPLIRIPYTYFKDICLNDLLLETSKFIVGDQI